MLNKGINTNLIYKPYFAFESLQKETTTKTVTAASFEINTFI